MNPHRPARAPRASLRTLLACTLMCVAVAGHATTTGAAKKKAVKADHTRTWTREPTSFLSLPLGGAMPSAASECPATDAPTGATAVPTHAASVSTAQPCWQGESNVKTLHNLPSPGFPLESVVAVDANGVIGSVIVNGMRTDFAQMKAYLTAQYGKPTRVAMQPLGRQGGWGFEVETLRWEGRTVSIRLDEVYNRLDMYRVLVLHKPSTLHVATFDGDVTHANK